MKFFFYGIFLDEEARKRYGINGPARYATVKDYATYGRSIVTAYRQADAGLSLTGLLADVPEEAIADLDALEAGYRRITVTTVQGDNAQMYVD